MDFLEKSIGLTKSLIGNALRGDIVFAALPQDDTSTDRARRAEDLGDIQSDLGYKYVHDEKLRLPISDLVSPERSKSESRMNMGMELAELLEWLEGQAENRIAIISNLKVWQALTRLPEQSSILENTLGAIKSAATKTDIQAAASALSPLSIFRKLETPASQDELEDEDFDEFTSLASYTNPFAVFDAPGISGRWMDDKVFASQRLAGLNPMAIHAVSTQSESAQGMAWAELRAKLSEKIDHTVLAQFGIDMTLEEAAASKRLYVCDYVALSEVELKEETTGVKLEKLLAPIALYVKSDSYPGLELAAIQLDQTPDSGVILARDKNRPGMANNWLMAKIILQISDVNYNQAVNHLLETHLIEDAIAVATRRQLAKQHPLNVLLSRHFTALLTINKAGEKLLLADTGMMQEILETGLDGALQLMSNRYANWSFDDLDFPARLKRRGMDDTEALTYYPYRDDGLLIWQVLGDYCEAYIKHYYSSDENVSGDYELQAWAKELSEQVNGFPKEIASIDSLITTIHRIVWTAGPQHAAVNFPQIDYFAFVPNMPTAYYAYPPKDFSNHAVSDEELLEFLPPASKVAGQMEVAFALSGYHYDSLLDYYDELEPGAAEVCKKFHDRLHGEVTAEINRRNKQRETHQGLLAYPYFLPANIPNSTSV